MFSNISGLPINEKELLLRLVIAGMLGLSIGLERGNQLKSAGLKTHAIVAIGASLMTMISKYGFFDVIHYTGVSVDPSRMASGIVSGISFLCAGTILNRTGSVQGLTTAAGIWTTCAIGIAVGVGHIRLAAIVATILLFLNYFSRSPIYRSYFPYSRRLFIQTSANTTITQMETLLSEIGVVMLNISLKTEDDNQHVSYDITVSLPGNVSNLELTSWLYKDPQITRISSTEYLP